MIGLGKSISHTQASMGYGWNQEKKAKVVIKNLVTGRNPKELTKEFKMFQALNQRCKRNTLSFVLSPAIQDRNKLMDAHKLYEVCFRFLQEMKLQDNQAVGFLHLDKKHMHIHLYVNRIGLDGKAFKDNYIGKRAQRAAEKVALQMGLKTVREVQNKKAKHSNNSRQIIRKAHEMVMLTKRPLTFKDYIEEMGNKGVKVIPSFNSKNNLQGFRFRHENNDFKGSEVSRLLSFQNLGHQIEENETNELNNIRRKKKKGHRVLRRL